MMRRLRYTLEPQDAGRTVKSIALRELRLSRGQFSSLKFPRRPAGGGQAGAGG